MADGNKPGDRKPQEQMARDHKAGNKKPWERPSRARLAKRAERGFGPRPKPGQREDGLHALYGLHTVIEALKNPCRKVRTLIATDNAAQRLKELVPDLAVKITPGEAEAISRQLTPDAVHQGLLLIAEPLDPVELCDLPADGLVLALDQVTDPHNVGAILRSAAAFSVAAVIVTGRNSPEVTGVLAKAASGALEHVPICEVQNLARALTELGERGYQRIGLDSDGPVPFGGITLRRPLCLVLGAEGKGLRPVTRAACDAIAHLSMSGAIRSLNVSNAAAISLYAATEALA
jgi:23S rRNA (guanosine2251-2'-O)-methyltransferase